MKDDLIILSKNESFVKDGKLLVEELQHLTPEMQDKRIVKVLGLINQYLEEFGSYGDIVKDVELNSLTEYDFEKGIKDYFSVACRSLPADKKHQLRFYLNGEYYIQEPSAKSPYIVSDCLPCMKLLPTLLMDNAIKYTPFGHEIDVNVVPDEYGRTITITNFGPMLDDGEEEVIFSINQNYRGYWASKAKSDGHGIGLKLSKLIVSAHPWINAQILASSAKEASFALEGIPYSKFVISLYFLNTKEDSYSKELDISNIRDGIAAFIFHEYIRVNPLLCKLATELSRAAHFKCMTGFANLKRFKELAFQLKSLIMEHTIWCHIIDQDLTIENDEDKGSNAIRFDTQLLSFIDEFKENNNYDISIEKQGDGFNLSPTFYSIDLFFYMFADLVTQCADSGDLDIFTDRDGMIFKFSSYNVMKKIENDRWEIMLDILDKHGLTASCRASEITISRLRGL